MLLQLFENPLPLGVRRWHPIDESPNFVCKLVFPLMIEEITRGAPAALDLRPGVEQLCLALLDSNIALKEVPVHGLYPFAHVS
jgi:hypothetical protein